MVYIHFPVNLTEEEQMLQAKYQKLKKKVGTFFKYLVNSPIYKFTFQKEKSCIECQQKARTREKQHTKASI
jgi:hypothetical protein